MYYFCFKYKYAERLVRMKRYSRRDTTWTWRKRNARTRLELDVIWSVPTSNRRSDGLDTTRVAPSQRSNRCDYYFLTHRSLPITPSLSWGIGALLESSRILSLKGLQLPDNDSTCLHTWWTKRELLKSTETSIIIQNRMTLRIDIELSVVS